MWSATNSYPPDNFLKVLFFANCEVLSFRYSKFTRFTAIFTFFGNDLLVRSSLWLVDLRINCLLTRLEVLLIVFGSIAQFRIPSDFYLVVVIAYKLIGFFSRKFVFQLCHTV